MKVREHRGSLADSMKTLQEVATLEELFESMRASFAMFPTFVFDPEQVQISPYCGRDERIGWDQTYIIEIIGYGVWGFIDGPIE